MAASALTLCISTSAVFATDLRMTFWTVSEAHLKMLNGIAESFKATHPDVNVNFETVPVNDYTQKLTFHIAGEASSIIQAMSGALPPAIWK
ncbi:sugar ABC transporter substrate-binding protein, partial [Rhizobium johnstonii]